MENDYIFSQSKCYQYRLKKEAGPHPSVGSQTTSWGILLLTSSGQTLTTCLRPFSSVIDHNYKTASKVLTKSTIIVFFVSFASLLSRMRVGRSLASFLSIVRVGRCE